MQLLTLSKNQLDDPSIKNLLSLCVYPAPGRLEQVCNRYRNELDLKLFTYEAEGKWIGCIGIKFTKPNEAVIQHIAFLCELGL